MAKVLTSSFCCLVLATPYAHAQDPKFYYCYAQGASGNTVYVSETAPVGPVSERRSYGARFVASLIERNLVPSGTEAYCVMRETLSGIATAKSDLRRMCNECRPSSLFEDLVFAGETRVQADPPPVARNDRPLTVATAAITREGAESSRPNVLNESATTSGGKPTAPPDALPHQIAAPLPHSLFIRLIPQSENASVQVHYQFFLCGQDIYVSYSLRPVPIRGVHEIRLNAAVTGAHMKPHHFIQTATMSPGHQLGCGFQKHKVATLADFESQLGQGRFSDGTLMWSQKEAIEHLLARFSMFASGAPWPAGSR